MRNQICSNPVATFPPAPQAPRWSSSSPGATAGAFFFRDVFIGRVHCSVLKSRRVPDQVKGHVALMRDNFIASAPQPKREVEHFRHFEIDDSSYSVAGP
jgi:hypothetical protein